MVPTAHMPGWLQAIANWNPVSAVCAGARALWKDPNPATAVHVWPMEHPVEASLIWSAGILLLAAFTATRLFQRRMTE
jgi:ABC-2 type transport system permease protein